MALVAILGDLHIGIKQDDPWIVKNQKKFFNFFFSECKARGVEATIQTGDWFDVRRGISQETLQLIREDLVPNFQSIGETYVIVGNHDMHLRETITPNSCREVLSHYDKFTVIEEPTTLGFDGVDIEEASQHIAGDEQYIKDVIDFFRGFYGHGLPIPNIIDQVIDCKRPH